MGVMHYLHHVIGHWTNIGISTATHTGNKCHMDDIILCLRSYLGQSFMGTLLMDEIRYNNKIYRYDPEQDAFVPVGYDITHWDQWGWIYLIVVLTAMVTVFSWF
jgi:hypothetical protein